MSWKTVLACVIVYASGMQAVETTVSTVMAPESDVDDGTDWPVSRMEAVCPVSWMAVLACVSVDASGMLAFETTVPTV